jgi:hypothetical protein
MLAAVFALMLALAVLPPDASAQIFSQDLTMQSTTTTTGMMGQGGGTITSTEYYSQNAMRMNQSDGNDTIILFDAEKIITIDNNKKTYMELTFAQLEQRLSKIGEQLGAKMGANPEQLKSMMKMMGITDTSFSVTKVGSGDTIAGYATDKYIVKGPMEIEVMAATDLKIPSSYYDVLKMQMPSIPIFDLKKMYDEMKKIEGFPLKTVQSMSIATIKVKNTKLVTSIEKEAIPASVFEIPEGYIPADPQLN